MNLSRRSLLSVGALAPLVPLAAGPARAVAQPLAQTQALPPPIGAAERHARLDKLRKLMSQQGIAALLVESGSTLDYFTGIQWGRSERVTAAVIPVSGQLIVITPHFEAPSVQETLAVPGEVRVWDEHDNPFAIIAGAVRDRAGATGRLAVEPTTRFFIVDGVRRAGPFEIVSGDALVRACRMFKSPAELRLMQAATDITMAAYAEVHAKVSAGMASGEIAALMNEATRARGGAPEFSLVLLNEASAYPHGSHQKQSVREGSVVLMDCGCAVHGYQSDISRTWVHGDPTPRQRKVWETVKRGQEVALETAKLGVACGSVDRAVRAYYEREGWGPGYRLPGLSHRTGHGIGLDGHESPYLVLSDETPLQPGMCFSDEPGLYIPGEFGVRLEDCWRMTESGPKLFSGLAASLEQPI